MTYRVATAGDGVFEVPAETWPDPGMVPGNTYTPENCLWFDDIVDGLGGYVPGAAEFLSVEVLQ